MSNPISVRWLMALLLIIATPAMVMAQDSEDADEDEALELQVQTVTGSRLRGGVSASPVFVLTREEIDRRGLRDIEDIVRYIPQNYSTMTAGGSFDNHSPRLRWRSTRKICLRCG